MKPDRLRHQRNGSGWSTRGALLTVLHAIVAWGLYSVVGAEWLSEPVLMAIMAIAVPIAAYMLARSAEAQGHSRALLQGEDPQDRPKCGLD